MKLVWVACSTCEAQWEEIDRDGVDSTCATCGSSRLERLAFGGSKKPGDLSRVGRADRIAGAARLAGVSARRSASEGGDWDHYEEIGNDPNDLEGDYWLTTDCAKLAAALAKEGIVLTEEEKQSAGDAYREGWDARQRRWA